MKKILLISTAIFLFYISGCDKIISKYRNMPDLGNGYKFEYDEDYTLSIVNSDNDLVINETILEYAFDSTFIIVSQRAWDSIPNIKSMNYSESNNAFEKSTFLQYWIINKKEKSVFSYDTIAKKGTYSNVYGPFKKDEFLQKRNELGVPKELKLKK